MCNYTEEIVIKEHGFEKNFEKKEASNFNKSSVMFSNYFLFLNEMAFKLLCNLTSMSISPLLCEMWTPLWLTCISHTLTQSPLRSNRRFIYLFIYLLSFSKHTRVVLKVIILILAHALHHSVDGFFPALNMIRFTRKSASICILFLEQFCAIVFFHNKQKLLSSWFSMNNILIYHVFSHKRYITFSTILLIFKLPIEFNLNQLL